MPSKALESLVVLLLAASAGGCADAAAPAGKGRLDLTVMPESLIASGRPLQGSFELRGLDRATHVAIPVDGAGYQTRSVALAAGVYSLQWQPRGQPDVSEQAAPSAARAPSTVARTVVIASNRVTSLTVRSTLNAAEAPQPVAAIALPTQLDSRRIPP